MAIKVDSFASASQRMNVMKPAQGIRTHSADTSFSMELSQQGQYQSKEQLNQLLEEIDKQGARLSQTPTFEEMRDYRELVKQFISVAVDQMYFYRSESGWDRLGRQKIYTTVKNIDRELETMAEKIRLGQADQLDIVARQDAIRGMLVDLYM